jgi:seryl-tRNA synthetase
MLEIQRFRDNPGSIVEALKKRNLPEAEEVVNKIVEIDRERRQHMVVLENLRKEANDTARLIGQLMGAGKKEEAEVAKARTGVLKEETKAAELAVTRLEAEQQALLITLPNTPHPSVPAGATPEDNAVVYSNGREVALPADAKPHWDLVRDLDIIDFELGAKITGSGFPVYKGQGAKLVRGLIQFFLDTASDAGYLEIYPPLMVNEASGYGTGQLPDKEGQMYHAVVDNLYLIPTAEVPITNLYRDVILEESQLPVQNCGYTPCFRREAGAAGKDTRGLNRLHQFDKVEIVEIAHPATSYDRLEEMVKHVRGLLEALELPYRQLLLCGGDMGFTSAKTYDMEVWCAAQAKWLEVSSISCFETFQANRLKLRFRDGSGKTQTAHTLNGSALALPRIMSSLLENNQQPDGSILLPKALHRYCGFERITKRA